MLKIKDMAFNSMKWLPRPLGNSNEDTVLFSKKVRAKETFSAKNPATGFYPMERFPFVA